MNTRNLLIASSVLMVVALIIQIYAQVQNK
jgi:hypothetical protein